MSAADHMTRNDYGELYHRVFDKTAGRAACREGWARWQKIWQSGDLLVLHPPGEPPPDRQPSDYFLVAVCGALRFTARASEPHFRTLPERWIEFSQTAKLEKTLNQNPRSAARAFLHNSLVDGYILHPVIGPAMAASIAWLITSHHGAGKLTEQYRMLGFDIAYVPGPPGQARMFNFRALMSMESDPDAVLESARSLPLPAWAPPPH